MRSVEDALTAAQRWLAVIPESPRYTPQRERMLTLRDILAHAKESPSEADLSAKLAIKGMVRFAQAAERENTFLSVQRWRAAQMH